MPATTPSLTSVVEDSLHRGRPPAAPLWMVDAARQRLVVWDAGHVQTEISVSTAAAGLGEQRDSGRTPRGFHEIRERIGAGAAMGQVFVGRRPTADIVPPGQWGRPGQPDLILTRILWLGGLEPGRNQGGAVDSHQRFIYLHGTNQEHLLGTPTSAGCVRIANRDMVRLFDALGDRPGWCWIGAILDDR